MMNRNHKEKKKKRKKKSSSKEEKKKDESETTEKKKSKGNASPFKPNVRGVSTYWVELDPVGFKALEKKGKTTFTSRDGKERKFPTHIPITYQPEQEKIKIRVVMQFIVSLIYRNNYSHKIVTAFYKAKNVGVVVDKLLITVLKKNRQCISIDTAIGAIGWLLKSKKDFDKDVAEFFLKTLENMKTIDEKNLIPEDKFDNIAETVETLELLLGPKEEKEDKDSAPPSSNRKSKKESTKATTTEVTELVEDEDEDFEAAPVSDEEDEEVESKSKKRKHDDELPSQEEEGGETEGDFFKKNYLANFHNQLMFLDQNIELASEDVLELLGDNIHDANASIVSQWKTISRLYHKTRKENSKSSVTQKKKSKKQ